VYEILSSTNEKMKQSYNTLSQRMEQLKKNMNKKNENKSQKIGKQKNAKNNEKSEIEQKLIKLDRELKKSFLLFIYFFIFNYLLFFNQNC